MSKITVQENIFGKFTLVHVTFGSFTSPTDTFPFAYHPFNGLDMCAVEDFQHLIFDNSQSPDKFTGKLKIVSHLKFSKQILKLKSMFTYTFTLHISPVIENTLIGHV